MNVSVLKAICTCTKSLGHVQLFVTQWTVARQAPLCPWDSLGMNTGVGCHFLFQGILLTLGKNPHLLCLLHWQVGSLPQVPSGKPNTPLYFIYNLSLL